MHWIFLCIHREHAGNAKSQRLLAVLHASQDLRRGGGLVSVVCSMAKTVKLIIGRKVAGGCSTGASRDSGIPHASQMRLWRANQKSLGVRVSGGVSGVPPNIGIVDV
jgi:hypothetical protein